MNKIIALLLLILTLGCSSDESPGASGTIAGNGQSYDFNRAYVVNDGWGMFSIRLTKGNIEYDNNTSQMFFADNLERILLLMVDTGPATSQLPSGTYRYDGDQTWLEARFQTDIQISDGQIADSNLIFAAWDVLPEQGQLIVTKHSDSRYTFNYDFVTISGSFSGSFSGNIIKVNY